MKGGALKERKIYYGWYMVLVGFFIMALVYASIVSCQGLYLKPVTEELNATRTQFSIVTGCIAFGLVIGSVFIGKVIKKRGLKSVMLASTGIIGLSLLGFSKSQEMWHFYVLALLMGIAFPGLTNISLVVLINNWFGEAKKGLAMSVAFAGSGIGGLVLTVVLSRVIASFGWRWAYMMNALAILIVAFPLILFTVVQDPAKRGLRRLGDREHKERMTEGTPLGEAKKTGAFWRLFISCLLLALVGSALLNHQVPYLTDIGFSGETAASIVAVAIGSLTVGKLILGTLYDKLGARFAALLANVLLIFAFAALLLTKNWHFSIYFYVVFYCIGGTTGTISPPIITGSVFGEKDYPQIIGLINVGIGIGAIFGSVLCAALYDWFGGYAVSWGVFLLLGIVIAVAQDGLLKKEKSSVS